MKCLSPRRSYRGVRILLMPNSWLARKNLALLLGGLLGLKLVLLPLLDWQALKYSELASKSRQLAKVEQILVLEDSYRVQARQLKASLAGNNGYFYEDDASTKLIIQRDVEAIFDQGGLNITGFSWAVDTLDATGSYRVLRATIYFTGATTTMMKTFWGLAISTRLKKVVEWSQQIKSFSDDPLGGTTGSVTLEFFAVKEELNAALAKRGQSLD